MAKKIVSYSVVRGAAFALLCSVGAAEAKNCDTTGRLAFLGTTKDNSQSVWLSATGRVPIADTGFALFAAQDKQQVDGWFRSRPGLRLSFSPNVSNGNGGTHKLFTYDQQQNECLLDTQNQKGGITFPPSWPNWPPSIKPPTGITPELPIGVKPPIGTLPPTGIMPTLPGGVTPPIGTLPPTGVMPELPVGVKPPIGTLPPTGVMPELPTVEKPAGNHSGSSIEIARTVQQTVCPASVNTLADAQRWNCLLSIPDQQAPLTPGRDFALAEKALWNSWIDSRYFNTTDNRHDLDGDGNGNSVTLGGDRSISDSGDLVAGAMLSLMQGHSSIFSDTLQTEVDAIAVGPYLGYRLTNNWSLDASFLYGRSDTGLEIAEAQGDYDADQYTLTSTLTGQYAFGDNYLRPKLTLNYTHIRNEAYDISVNVLGQTIGWDIDDDRIDLALAESVLEINRIVRLENEKVLVPYIELGARYDIEQANDGEIVGGDLQLESTSRWTGTLRLGGRYYVSQTTYLEASAGYLSFAQNGLDVWEGRFYLSHLF